MKRVRSRLTYANVVATLALFLVLGGGAAFAASKLARNSVGTRQIKNGAITTAKLRKGAVTGPKVKLSTLGRVPSATDAVNATNSQQLAGVPASGYQGRTMWALVGGSGSVLAQSGGVSVQVHVPPGRYYLHFPQAVADKAIVVTPAYDGANAEEVTSAKVLACGGAIECIHGTNTTSDVYVETTVGGPLKDSSFYVVVVP